VADAPPPFGVPAQRNQMLYLDSAAIGWADNSQFYAVPVVNNTYRTYEIAVDADGGAKVSVNGNQALARTGFVSNGAIAIGDQTNDVNVDSVLRIRSVKMLCP
jgi:hypothetical protein